MSTLCHDICLATHNVPITRQAAMCDMHWTSLGCDTWAYISRFEQKNSSLLGSQLFLTIWRRMSTLSAYLNAFHWRGMFFFHILTQGRSKFNGGCFKSSSLIFVTASILQP
ncbi:hypothetical protein O6P43_028025 [Quillaja saponaria]|uniref:Uncharacterized protein n=1 Tax=Quillaja saponaria TaxID=32244 RepID=A0AAD7PEF3_QUISA|nr:hypothetical protein O6P43_028025 [Quillaja saponaria]